MFEWKNKKIVVYKSLAKNYKRVQAVSKNKIRNEGCRCLQLY